MQEVTMNLRETDVENARIVRDALGLKNNRAAVVQALEFMAHAAPEMRRGGKLLLRKSNRALVELVMERDRSV